MKIALFLALLLTSSLTFSSVIRDYDEKNSCDLYTATDKIYGFSLTDMEVDFDNREVLVQPMINIVLGRNIPLVNFKVAISESNPSFKMLINQLNRKLFLLEKLCITQDKKLIYAEVMTGK